MKIKCLNCGHKWKNKNNARWGRILYCPRCKFLYWDKGATVVCEICKKHIINPEFHHKDKNKKNNDYGNRMILCKRCHHSLHTAERSLRKKIRTGTKQRTMKELMFVDYLQKVLTPN
jgi:hypothetical protein